MKLLYVLFYNYARWFERVKISSSPGVFKAFFAIAILLIIAICAIGDIAIYHNFLTVNAGYRSEMIVLVSVIIFVILYFCLLFDGKAKNIMSMRPKLFGSDALSVLVTVVFTVLCLGTILFIP